MAGQLQWKGLRTAHPTCIYSKCQKAASNALSRKPLTPSDHPQLATMGIFSNWGGSQDNQQNYVSAGFPLVKHDSWLRLTSASHPLAQCDPCKGTW